ncbi:MAG: HAD family hydrolase [Candidatus Hodarchaeota archaeon]
MSLEKRSTDSFDEVKAILFDFGGTLYHVSFNEVELAQRILKQLGKGIFSREKVEQALIAAEDGLAKALAAKYPDRTGYVSTSEDWILFNQFILRTLGISDLDRSISRAMQEQWELFWERMQGTEAVFKIRPEWREIFNSLAQRGYKLGVISNTSVDLKPWLKKDQVIPYLSVVLQSYEFGRAKPNKSIFHQACAELALEPHQCIYVGNHYRIDIVGAHRAGLVPIFITDGRNRDEIPAKRPFDFRVIDSLTEILALLPSLPS